MGDGQCRGAEVVGGGLASGRSRRKKGYRSGPTFALHCYITDPHQHESLTQSNSTKRTRLDHANDLIPPLLRLIPERFKQPTEHVKVRRRFGIDEPFWPLDGFGCELRCCVPPLEGLGEGHPEVSGGSGLAVGISLCGDHRSRNIVVLGPSCFRQTPNDVSASEMACIR